MIARGQGGKIINMSSQAGRRGEALVVGLLRLQGGGDLPDPVGRARSHQAPHQRQRHLAGRRRHADVGSCRFAVRQVRAPPLGEKKRLVGEAVPFGRMGVPDDHAGAAVFLASSDSDYVVAQTLNVDGGNWMS